MRLVALVLTVSAVLLASAALAEQVGGPSGPDKGQLSVGAEAIFRTNVDILPSHIPGRHAAKSRTFYGVAEYGITDCLSLRGKAGVAEWEADVPPSPYRPKYDFGLAWAAGLKWRICRPEEHGTALALSGQYARSEPDEFVFPGGLARDQNVETQEWTAALTVGVPHGSARPYAGVVYSDLQIDVERWRVHIGGPPTITPVGGEKRHHVGAVVGMDHDMGNAGFFNIEARGFDEEGISGSLNFEF